MARKSFKSDFDAILLGDSDYPETKHSHVDESKKALQRQINFFVDDEVAEKINAISYWERKSKKDILRAALLNFIATYEQEKGAIQSIPR